jgi:hypothetical protein
MDRKYGCGKPSDKCEKCGCTCGHKKETKTRKPSVRGQQIKALMAERKSSGHPITLGEASKIVSQK